MTATNKTPIVMAAIGDAVGNGFVKSLAQPGGNVTGLSFLDPDISTKRLELLKEAIPRVVRVAVLRHVTSGKQSLAATLAASRPTVRILTTYTGVPPHMSTRFSRAPSPQICLSSSRRSSNSSSISKPPSRSV